MAKLFTRAKADRIEELLQSLVILGSARQVDDNKFVAALVVTELNTFSPNAIGVGANRHPAFISPYAGAVAAERSGYARVPLARGLARQFSSYSPAAQRRSSCCGRVCSALLHTPRLSFNIR